MNGPPRFRALGEGPRVTIRFDGTSFTVPAGVNVAAALLAAGITRVRTTPAGAAPRAPYCMMGACFECLVEIDGVPARQACMTPVREGMEIRTQLGARTLDAPEPGHER